MKKYLQYLVILLDNTSVSYCHADNPLKERSLMPLETLRSAILFGMKNNLMIQFVYPNYELPKEYKEVIQTIDHFDAVASTCEDKELTESAEVIIFNDWQCMESAVLSNKKTYVIRTTKAALFSNYSKLSVAAAESKRIIVVITDEENFSDCDVENYKAVLLDLGEKLYALYKQGEQPQINILTDRMQLSEMRNCDAGLNNITVAPNGKFYLCPAFYYDEERGVSNRMNHVTKEATRSVGDLTQGVLIPNRQLLQLDHAPLCRICDSYHCNRCIWLNQKLTWDSNTPSHQQCIISHIERNASRELAEKLREDGYDIEEIKEIGYLDPFDVREEH